MEYLGACGTLIHEKNLKWKISCQTPFNLCYTWKLLFITSDPLVMVQLTVDYLHQLSRVKLL